MNKNFTYPQIGPSMLSHSNSDRCVRINKHDKHLKFHWSSWLFLHSLKRIVVCCEWHVDPLQRNVLAMSVFSKQLSKCLLQLLKIIPWLIFQYWKSKDWGMVESTIWQCPYTCSLHSWVWVSGRRVQAMSGWFLQGLGGQWGVPGLHRRSYTQFDNPVRRSNFPRFMW